MFDYKFYSYTDIYIKTDYNNLNFKRQYIIFDGDIYFSIYFKLFDEMNKKVSIQNFPDYFISEELKFKSIKYNV